MSNVKNDKTRAGTGYADTSSATLMAMHIQEAPPISLKVLAGEKRISGYQHQTVAGGPPAAKGNWNVEVTFFSAWMSNVWVP